MKIRIVILFTNIVYVLLDENFRGKGIDTVHCVF